MNLRYTKHSIAYGRTLLPPAPPVFVGDKDLKISMPEYRFYTLLRGDKIAGPATQVECSSDEEAISQAKKFINGLDIEVWQGARLIARLQSPRR
jgi:hypothetical protein